MFEEDEIVKYQGKYRIVKATRSMGVYFKDLKDTNNPALGNLKDIMPLKPDDLAEILNDNDEFYRILDISAVAIKRLFGI